MGNPNATIGRFRILRRVALLILMSLLAVGAIVGAMAVRGDGSWGRNRDSDSAELPADAALVVGAGEIDVEGGILPLSPLPSGIVRAIRVRDGQAVIEGQELIALDSTPADVQLVQAKLSEKLAALQLEQVRQTARQHGDSQKQQSLAVEVAKFRIVAAKPQIERLEHMVKSKLVDEADLQAARDTLVVLEKSLQGEKLRLEQIENFDETLAVRQAEAQQSLAAHAVTTAGKQQAYYTLTAPKAGVVLRVLARQGQLWTGMQRDPAAWFLPDLPWVVRCEIDQQFVAQVRPGMPCDIHDDRAEGVTWKGTVKTVSGWVGPRRTFGEDLTTWRDVRVVECIVALENPGPNVRVGQRVRVVIRKTPSPTPGQAP